MTVSFPARLVMSGALTCLLAGCAGFPFGKTPPDTYELSAPANVRAAAPAVHRRQLLIPAPSALKALSSNQVVVRTSPSAIQYLSDSQWSDTLTSMVQARLIQAYEETGKVGGVGRPGDGLAIDFRILTDIRAFSVSTVGSPRATVDIAVRILNDRNGVVVDQRDFRAVSPVSGTGNPAFITALNRAFDKTLAEIVGWTLEKIARVKPEAAES
jgi:cholesterol transport system auxiliary component